jgi:hypothetical protein
MNGHEQNDAGRARADFVDALRELCIVFRVESGITCRSSVDAVDTCCDAAIADAIHRSVRLLLRDVSERRRASAVTLSVGSQADGSVLVRVEIEEPPPARGISAPALAQLVDLRSRLAAVGVQLEFASDSLQVRIVVPRALVSPK